MNDMIKKYWPYLLIIFGVFMIFPVIFIPGAMNHWSAVAYDFVFPITTIACAAHYCSKYGLDFLFALIAPIVYLPSMLIYNGGFSSKNLATNLILLVVYLIAGIFGLFLGDLAFGDKRREREKAEKEAAEEYLLQAKRHEKEQLESMADSDASEMGEARSKRRQQPHRKSPRRTSPKPAPKRNTASEDSDDFNYDKYLSDIDRKSPTESEIDDILNEYRGR